MSLRELLAGGLSEQEFYEASRARLIREGVQDRWQKTTQWVSQNFPVARQRLIAQADQALQGLQILPGTAGKPYFTGNPPQWHANPVHDEEYVWGLNRMYHWRPLLQAWAFTGKPEYARKVAAELADWIANCPRPAINAQPEAAYGAFYQVDPWRSLEAGIRMFTVWPMVMDYLVGTEFLGPDLLARYAVSLHQHAEVLEIICPIFWPTAAHNHYIMEMLGLFATAVQIPEFKNSARWRSFAVRELERCAAAQLTPEGGQIEGCPHYHNVCVEFFQRAIRYAQRSGMAFSPAFLERTRGAITYSIESLRPTGQGVPWGDSDVDPGGVLAAVLGYLMFSDPRPLALARRLARPKVVEEACLEVILTDRADDAEHLIDVALGRKDAPTEAQASEALPCAYWAKALEQVALRTSWNPDALSLFFACRSPVNNGHAHIDPMGYDFTAFGKALLIDPGRFTYREDADRKEFKSAAYHNTLTVDGHDPFAYISSWDFGPQKEGRIIGMYEDGERLLAAEAMQKNFAPATHRRLVAIIDQQALLVLDVVEGLQAGQTLQIWHHVDSQTLQWDRAARTAQTSDQGPNVALLPSLGLKGRILPGRVAEHLDQTRPTSRLLLEDTNVAAGTRAYAVLIVPTAGKTAPTPTPEICLDPTGLKCRFSLGTKSYRLHWQLGLAPTLIG